MPTKIQKLVYKMLTENTGRHICDSGGAYGRHWERNQKLTIKDFIASPQATLEINEYGDCFPSASVFHALSQLNIDDSACKHFNILNTTDAPWDEECEFWGVNVGGAAYLRMAGLIADPRERAGNTCNWDSNNLSQAVQYVPLVNDDGDNYVLIQTHNGCDLRGGYTNARLFKNTNRSRELWQILEPWLAFEIDGVVIDIWGPDVVDVDGSPMDRDVLKGLASRHTEIIHGSASYG